MTRDRAALLDSYCHTLALVRRLKARAPEADRPILAGMEADLGWIVEYLAGGFPPPGQSRARTIPVDPQKVLARMRCPASPPLASRERARAQVAKALGVLSPQEKETFLLVVGERFSLGEVAEFLRINRSTVQSYLNRARAKLRFLPHR
ncbi:MAG: sigma factor-like helix-turn-helix DNA-binding protein [Patescibacteria group bacterium]